MRTLLSHPLTIIVLSVIALSSVISFFVSARSSRTGTETLDALDMSLARQQERVEALELQAELSNDPFIQEKIQRDERLLQRPGEVVLQLPVVTSLPVIPEPTPAPIPVWQEWKNLLLR